MSAASTLALLDLTQMDNSDLASANLAAIPPAQLIQIIAQLKTLLSGPNSALASQIFTAYPAFATTAAQALLAMGLIDLDIVQEAAQSANPVVGLRPAVSAVPTPPQWAHLPGYVVTKLQALDPVQADLVAQVLSFTPAEIAGMDSEKKTIVETLRAQYF